MTLEEMIGQFRAYTEYPNQDTFVISNQECKDILKYLTELQDQKTGKWVKYSFPRCGEQHYQCTCCDNYINFGVYSDYYLKAFKYCPNCGARMKESEVPQNGDSN